MLGSPPTNVVHSALIPGQEGSDILRGNEAQRPPLLNACSRACTLQREQSLLPSTRESLRAATKTQHSHNFLKKEMSRSTSDISEGAKTSTCFYFIALKVNVLKKREKLNTAAVTGNEKRCTDLIRVLPRHSANFRC